MSNAKDAVALFDKLTPQEREDIAERLLGLARALNLYIGKPIAQKQHAPPESKPTPAPAPTPTFP